MGNEETKSVTVLDNNNNLLYKTIDMAFTPYSFVMSTNQAKTLTLALYELQNSPNLDEDRLYEIDLEKYALLFNNSQKRSLRKHLLTAADTLFKENPKLIIQTGKEKIRTTVFQSVITYNGQNKIAVRFTTEFRDLYKNMKRVADFKYRIPAVMNFSCKYTFAVYEFLLAKAAICRQKQTSLFDDNEYQIEFSFNELLHTIFDEDSSDLEKYMARPSRLTDRILNPAIDDINSVDTAELKIVEGSVKPITGPYNKTSGYTMTIKVLPSIENEVFLVSLYDQSSDPEIPPLEYTVKLIEKIFPNVAEHFIQKVRDSNDPERIWKYLLYTLQDKKNDIRYLVNVWTKQYEINKDLMDLFKVAFEKEPGIRTELCLHIFRYYMEHEADLSKNRAERENLKKKKMLEHYGKILGITE